MKSSSLHSLNSDPGLSKWGKRAWYLLNYANNNFLPRWKSENLELRQFVPNLSDYFWDQIDPKSSPTRALSDLFWMQLPWEEIAAKLGKLSILDTGCGSGRYGLEIQKHSHGGVLSYTGIDESSRPNWEETMREHKFVRLVAAGSENFSSLIPAETNFFMSQSAIEHFPEDVTYFRQVRDFLKTKTSPWMQVHLFPSAACLPLYRYHGVRQYVPRTVSPLTSLFPTAQSTLFSLGGQNCNNVHSEFISKPIFIHGKEDRRNTETDVYRAALKSAIARDVTSTVSPSFYALVIAGNTSIDFSHA